MSAHYRVNITRWLSVSDCSLFHYQFDRGCRVL